MKVLITTIEETLQAGHEYFLGGCWLKMMK